MSGKDRLLPRHLSDIGVCFAGLRAGKRTGRFRPDPAVNRMSCSAHRGSQADRLKAHPLRKFDLVFSMSALRVFKRAHKREVEKAMRDGRNVPERVLEEFPDLKDCN